MFTGLFQDKTVLRALSARTPEQALQRVMQSKRLSPYRLARNRTIGFFIVDYVFPDQRLIVELIDPRALGSEQDKKRIRMLEEAGYRVLRLPRSEMTQRPGRARLHLLRTLKEMAGAQHR